MHRENFVQIAGKGLVLDTIPHIWRDRHAILPGHGDHRRTVILHDTHPKNEPIRKVKKQRKQPKKQNKKIETTPTLMNHLQSFI